ncbi:MAG: hypothetical protein K8R58_13895, partial [Bacteroidales bacterium]|nr:hypothetical protein [Bacteroidales bacterium]
MGKFTIINRKKRWGFTFFGHILKLIILLLIIFFIVKNIQPFLSENNPIDGDILVVEGFLPDYALKEAMNEFNRNNYKLLVITGKPIEKGYYLSEYKTNAKISAATLIKMGFDENLIVTVSISKNVMRNRTYAT